MIKVLHIGLSANPGGVENLVLNYYRNIDKTTFVFDFLDMYGDGLAFSNEIYSMGGNIISTPNYKRNPIKSSKSLYSIIKKNKYDVVHIHMQSTANILPIITALKCKNVEVIGHSHSSATPNGVLRKILDFVNKKLLKIMPINKWGCGVIAGEWMWGNRFKSENVINNAIEYDQYKLNEGIREKIRKKCGFKDDDRVIGFVGRFGDEKNVFFLIDILLELTKISSNYKLLTVGGNGLYEEFYLKLKDNKLLLNYYSAGIQNSAKDWYQAMDAFLLPSFFEGFPVVGIEAQAREVPCFFSNRISIEIDISHSSHFLSIDKKNDSEKWAMEIHRCLNEGQNDKIIFPDEYKIEYATKRLENKYKSILSIEKLGE